MSHGILNVPPPSYVISFAYIWAFPMMVPCFAMIFGFIDIRRIWSLERVFYGMNSRDSFLFSHFDRIKLDNLTTFFYRCHPFFAGISLLLSYVLFAKEMTSDKDESNHIRFIYIITSSLMAWYGGKLVPLMYGNSSAKWWTKLQSQLVFGYNIITVIAIISSSKQLLDVCNLLSMTLLICAGVLERAYVLFVLPWIACKNEPTYIQYYSIQFQTATIASWIITGVTFVIRNNRSV